MQSKRVLRLSRDVSTSWGHMAPSSWWTRRVDEQACSDSRLHRHARARMRAGKWLRVMGAVCEVVQTRAGRMRMRMSEDDGD